MAAGALLLLVLLLPPAAAQAPEPVAGSALYIKVTCQRAILEPDWASQDETICVIEDLSRDSVFLPGQSGGTSTSIHVVDLSYRVRNESADAEGWQVVLGASRVSLIGGNSYPFSVNVKATPVIDTQDYHFDIIADYTGPGGHTQQVVVPFTAEVNPYDFALLSWAGPAAQRAGQDEVVVYSLSITNTAVYPDSYRFTVNAPSDLRVSAPPNIYIPAGETRTVNVSVLTPHGKLYEIGKSHAITIKVNSVTGTGVYGATGVLQMRGAYIPIYWIPLLLVGLASAGVLTRGIADKSERRKLEKGHPRRVDLSPRQAVLLAELRRSDPEAYKEKKKALDTVYAERRGDYRAHRKERMAADRLEAKEARAEFIAKKKAKREARAAAKVQAKKDKKAAKLARKAERKEAKLLKKKEKVLNKKRAKLEKAQAKLAKKQAKIDAKEAKAAAKQAKKDERLAKKAAKDAKKQK